MNARAGTLSSRQRMNKSPVIQGKCRTAARVRGEQLPSWAPPLHRAGLRLQGLGGGAVGWAQRSRAFQKGLHPGGKGLWWPRAGSFVLWSWECHLPVLSVCLSLEPPDSSRKAFRTPMPGWGVGSEGSRPGCPPSWYSPASGSSVSLQKAWLACPDFSSPSPLGLLRGRGCRQVGGEGLVGFRIRTGV